MNKTKKSIAFVIGGLTSGGAERVICTIANYVCLDYNVYIFPLVKTKIAYSFNSSIIVEPCRETENLSFLDNFKIISNLSKKIKIYNIDLVLSFITNSNIISIIASKIKNVPIIISERNYPEKEQIKLIWKILRTLTYPLADELVVQTSLIKRYFEKTINSTKISVIPNPLPFEFKAFQSNLVKEKIVLNVGRLEDQKNQKFLIDAFSKIKFKDWRLQIVGNGSLKTKLMDRIKKLNLTGQVEILPSTKDIISVYKRASIFAFCSHYEGFPNSLMEAMHMGLPCISTDCPTGPAELIDNGVNGLLIPMNDLSKMVEKLNFLIKNENERIALGKNAHFSTLINNNANHIIELWLALMRRTIK